jgi:hypothetical protein
MTGLSRTIPALWFATTPSFGLGAQATVTRQ